ncbi:hypothetical protein BMB171_C0906 [Bacillus thuringiensis BMB171]|nr:hypothetical protein BMB171_C0906 [Bacillus thuringiensis BMB171]
MNNNFNARIVLSRLPFRNRLPAHMKFFSQIILRPISFFPFFF